MDGTLEIREEPAGSLPAYAGIPIAFPVRSVLDLVPVEGGLGGVRLVERHLPEPWVKDYDADSGEGPARWAGRFDLSRWGFLSAFLDGRRVGGAAVAMDTPGLDRLRGRSDVAVLFDLRVHPDHRGAGIGRRLFRAAERFAVRRGATLLTVETQNVNVPACRLYASEGCELAVVDRLAYPGLPGEVELSWYKRIGPGA